MPKPKKAAPPRSKVAASKTLQAAPAADLDEPELFPEIPHARKRAFLVAYARCGRRVHAARLIGIDDRMHWYWLKHDPQYAIAFQQAERMAGDTAEDKAYQLALDGYEQGIWHQGVKVGEETRYLPTLLLALLNAAKPDKYKYRQSVEHTISPALEALQRQWQQAALPPAHVPTSVVQEATDAEFEAIPVPPVNERPPMPGTPTTAEIFSALDALNGQGDAPDGDMDEDS